MIALESTTFDSGIVVGQFGGVFVGKSWKEILTSEHAAHRSPVRMLAHQALHHERFAFNVDHRMGAFLEVEPLAHRLWGDRHCKRRPTHVNLLTSPSNFVAVCYSKLDISTERLGE